MVLAWNIMDFYLWREQLCLMLLGKTNVALKSKSLKSMKTNLEASPVQSKHRRER